MDENKEVTRGEQLRRALVYDKKNGYDRLLPGELEAILAAGFGDGVIVEEVRE